MTRQLQHQLSTQLQALLQNSQQFKVSTMRTCNYKKGRFLCCATCHKTSSGRVQAKCRKHLAAENKNSRQKALGKLGKQEAVLLKLEAKNRSCERMRKYRKDRKTTLNGIANPRVKRIAGYLDQLKDNKEYVIVPEVLSTGHIKGKLKSQPITFSGTEPPYTRSMQQVNKDGEVVVQDILDAIKIIFPSSPNILVKILRSKAGDPAQLTHTDYVSHETYTPLHNLKQFHYSAVISIQADTRLLIGVSRKEIDIPLHSMIFFRGDMFHAGAAYSTSHSRLFVSVSSVSFPATENVNVLKHGHFKKV